MLVIGWFIVKIRLCFCFVYCRFKQDFICDYGVDQREDELVVELMLVADKLLVVIC